MSDYCIYTNIYYHVLMLIFNKKLSHISLR